MRLSLALLFVFATTASADPKPKKVDWPARAKAVAWTLDRDANVLDSMRSVSGYDVVLVHDGANGSFGDLTVRIEKAGKSIHSWAGHQETPLVVVGDTLYYSDHSPIATGATIVAVDLKKKKELWRTAVHGIGEVGHSKYRNRVRLDVTDVVTVQGEESSGSYVELLDLKTGKMLANDPRKSSP